MVEKAMGEGTRRAKNMMRELEHPDGYGDGLPALEYWNDPKNFASFSDTLIEAAIAVGYSGDREDRSAVCRYIMDCGAKRGIDISPWKRSLQNWLRRKEDIKADGGRKRFGEPDRDEQTRDRIYQICFALDMKPDQVKDFFRRGYWERVVNYKSESECVYWYCLQRGLSYERAVTILKRVQEEREGTQETEHFPMEPTAAIGQAVLACPDERALVRYLVDHKESFLQKNVTAIAKVEKLLADGKELAKKLDEKENKPADRFFRGKRDVTDERYLNFLYGVFARTHKKGKYICKDPYSGPRKSFPLGYARANIPSAHQLSKIRKGGDGGMMNDSIRKTLVFLDFAHFALGEKLAEYDQDVRRMPAGKKSGSGGSHYASFLKEINEILEESDFPELYLRNPYDWLFAYCVFVPSRETRDDVSLEAFRGMFYRE